MEKVKGLAIELDMDHLSVDRGLKGLKDNIRTVNSEMRRNMSAFDRSDRSVKKYETSLAGLNKKLDVQKRAVAEAEKEYNKMVDEYGRGSKEAEAAAREYNNQAAALNNLERYIERTKKELAEFEKQQRIANSGWTKMGDKLEGYGSKLKGIGGQLDKTGSKLTKGITLPALGAATAVGGIVGAFGWKRLTGLDSAQAQLKGLGYSTKEVGRISDQVTTAIDGGMTTMAEGTAVAAGALAAGVKEGKELERYIKLVGDAAVGANRPVDEMAMIFNRVQGNGKLMTMELNSIEQGMPGFSKAMSKHLGVSSEKFREMVTDGKVSSKDFLKVMEDFAGGMASAYAESWDGMVANTKAYLGIIGENFLRGTFQDSKKSLADFIEMLKSPEIQQRAEEMGEKARVAFNKMKDSIMGVVEWYQNLDDGQKTMIKRLGLTAVAAGPVIQTTGKLTSGLGSVFEMTGKVSKAIGVARGAGLVAGLTALGPGAVAGIAVAGLAAVGVGLYTLRKRSKEAEEVNLELAESLSDEAIELENAANTFDKLSGKAKISNSELAELNNLNKQISESSNPGEIDELQKRYNDLARESGLSKDELRALFKANDTIIKQSPDVKQSVSDQGNAFAENTKAVREQIEALYELSLVELEGQVDAALEKEVDLRKEKNKLQQEHNGLLDEMQVKLDANKLSDQENQARQSEINELLDDRTLTYEEAKPLQEELTALLDIENGDHAKAIDYLQKKLDKKNKAIESTEEDIELNKEIISQASEIALKQAGINEEGEKGLAALDKSIAKNDEEIAKLEDKRKKNGELTEKEQERYEQLSETNQKQKQARDFIHDELGLYKDLNSLVENRLDKADKETQKKVESLAKSSEIKVEEGNIVGQLQKKNSEIDKNISKVKEEGKAQGLSKKEIEQQVSELEQKKGKNSENIKKILQELDLWKDVDKSIRDGINKEIEKGKATDDTTSKSKKQGDQIGNNNKKTDEGIKKEEARSKEAGKDVDKKVSLFEVGLAAIDKGARAGKSKRVSLFEIGLAAINKGASQGRSKEVSLWQSGLDRINTLASSPVTKTINFIGKGLSKLKFWADGTPPSGHPGGLAMIGEEGRELVTLPGGQSFISPNSHTMLDLPRGSHVVPNPQTERIMKAMPKYAGGTNGWSDSFGNSEFARLLSLNNRTSESNVVVRGGSNTTKPDDRLVDLLLEQNEHLKKSNDLLSALLSKDLDLYKLNKKVDEGINNMGDRRRAAFGG